MTNPQPAPDIRRGLLFGLATYLIWGLFPLYFIHMHPAGALEVIVHRTVWGLLFALLILAIKRHLHQVRDIVKDPKLLLPLMAAGCLIIINWTTYIYAVQTDRVVDASLGYFINPLFTVFLALVVLRERLSILEYIALGLGALALAVYVIGLGYIPWIAVVLPASFGIYSLVKKNVATRVPAVAGMVIETATVTPFLLGYLIYLIVQGRSSLQIVSTDYLPIHLALLIGAGVITVIPLVFLAMASRDLPLGTLGMIQYVSPVMQLIIGVWVLGEPMEPMRWASTFIIWMAVIVVSIDMWRKTRRVRKLQVKADEVDV